MAYKLLCNSFNINHNFNYKNMRAFGNLLRDVFNPEKSKHKILRYRYIFKTKKEKELYIADCVEALNENIIIDDY